MLLSKFLNLKLIRFIINSLKIENQEAEEVVSEDQAKEHQGHLVKIVMKR